MMIKRFFRHCAGLTLIELLVTTLIISFLFGIILTIYLNSHQSWRVGKDNLIEQQDARRAMDEMVKYLRQSNPSWDIGGTAYDAVISEQNKRIDFYDPVFDAQGAISSLRKITFKLNPSDASQLLKKIGTADAVVIANEVDSISFAGGCAACASYACTTPDSSCPVVKIQLTSHKSIGFTLESQVTLRNKNPVLPSDTDIVEPQQGEF